jgi:uncharacterized membrane protein
MGPMGPHGNQNTWNTISILLGIIIVLLILVISYLWFNHGRNSTKKEKERESILRHVLPKNNKIDVALKLLNKNEKLIVRALIESGGEMLQKDISAELGLSRVQTHRTVQSLIERDIVTTERHFNTNRIRLSAWLRK